MRGSRKKICFLARERSEREGEREIINPWERITWNILNSVALALKCLFFLSSFFYERIESLGKDSKVVVEAWSEPEEIIVDRRGTVSRKVIYGLRNCNIWQVARQQKKFRNTSNFEFCARLSRYNVGYNNN